MEKFTTLTAVAAPLLIANINTDVIIRIERLVILPRGKLGPYGFEAWRYGPDESEDPNFLLNRPAFRNAGIMLGGPNFACGSSREAAVWAMWDMGYRCVIAPSFGEIFYTNCFQNGMLPIILPTETIAELAKESGTDSPAPLTIDLVSQKIRTASGKEYTFSIEAARREALLEGLDEIAMTLRDESEITSYQQAGRSATPWLFKPQNSDISNERNKP